MSPQITPMTQIIPMKNKTQMNTDAQDGAQIAKICGNLRGSARHLREIILSLLFALCLPLAAQTPLQQVFLSVTGLSVFYPDVQGVRAVFRSSALDALLETDALFDGDAFMAQFADDEPESLSVAELMLSDMDNRDEAGIVESSSEDAVPAEHFTDSSGQLRRFSYGAEQFSVRERDGIKTVTDSADSLIIRRTFDRENHLTMQERFKIGSSSRDLKVLATRVYAYHDGEKLPYQMTEDVTEGNKHIVTDYDAQGFAVKTTEAHYAYPDPNDKKHKNDPPTLVQDKKNVWAYDDEQRLVAEEATTYLYSTTASGKQKIETNVIKKMYDYGGQGGAKPDRSYFENENMRMRTVYESENVYNETMYFDGGFTVQARYENGIKVLEIVSLNGTEMRRRTFAQ